MIYNEEEFLRLEVKLLDFSNNSMLARSLIMGWSEECCIQYSNSDGSMNKYLKYSDARKKLAAMLQDLFIDFEKVELTYACDLILFLLSFSDCNDEYLRTDMQKAAWCINDMIKKYNFTYWELILREAGQDETDIVRSIYQYIKSWENRMEAADTLREYLATTIVDQQEIKTVQQHIMNLESGEWLTI